jgi:CelD/BcsL family acetyltransferase involved in cellulose biosynthesis
MSAETITTVEGLAAIERAWLDLCQSAPGTTPFQTPMWLLPWWECFGSNDLTVIATRENGRLTGLAPLYVIREDDESLGLLLGSGISDYLGAVGDAGEVMPALAGIDCQMWDFQQLRPGSPLLLAPPPEGWSDESSESDVCPVLRIEGAGEELENLVSTHFRKKLRYYRRALARGGEVRVESATRENLPELLDALFELHAARWRRRGLPGVLADDVAQRFHRAVAPRMLEAGALRMYATRVANRIVAVFYGFALGDTIYYYLSGYDPDLEKLSIGTLVVAHAVEEAVRGGAAVFDFLRGAEEYKYAWGAADRPNRRRQLIRGMPPS